MQFQLGLPESEVLHLTLVILNVLLIVLYQEYIVLQFVVKVDDLALKLPICISDEIVFNDHARQRVRYILKNTISVTPLFPRVEHDQEVFTYELLSNFEHLVVDSSPLGFLHTRQHLLYLGKHQPALPAIIQLHAHVGAGLAFQVIAHFFDTLLGLIH